MMQIKIRKLRKMMSCNKARARLYCTGMRAHTRSRRSNQLTFKNVQARLCFTGMRAHTRSCTQEHQPTFKKSTSQVLLDRDKSTHQITHEQSANMCWAKLRLALPAFDWLASYKNPSFDDVEKGLQIFGIINALMISCVANLLTEDFSTVNSRLLRTGTGWLGHDGLSESLFNSF